MNLTNLLLPIKKYLKELHITSKKVTENLNKVFTKNMPVHGAIHDVILKFTEKEDIKPCTEENLNMDKNYYLYNNNIYVLTKKLLDACFEIVNGEERDTTKIAERQQGNLNVHLLRSAITKGITHLKTQIKPITAEIPINSEEDLIEITNTELKKIPKTKADAKTQKVENYYMISKQIVSKLIYKTFTDVEHPLVLLIEKAIANLVFKSRKTELFHPVLGLTTTHIDFRELSVNIGRFIGYYFSSLALNELTPNQIKQLFFRPKDEEPAARAKAYIKHKIKLKALINKNLGSDLDLPIILNWLGRVAVREREAASIDYKKWESFYTGSHHNNYLNLLEFQLGSIFVEALITVEVFTNDPQIIKKSRTVSLNKKDFVEQLYLSAFYMKPHFYKHQNHAYKREVHSMILTTNNRMIHAGLGYKIHAKPILKDLLTGPDTQYKVKLNFFTDYINHFVILFDKPIENIINIIHEGPSNALYSSYQDQFLFLYNLDLQSLQKHYATQNLPDLFELLLIFAFSFHDRFPADDLAALKTLRRNARGLQQAFEEFRFEANLKNLGYNLQTRQKLIDARRKELQQKQQKQKKGSQAKRTNIIKILEKFTQALIRYKDQSVEYYDDYLASTKNTEVMLKMTQDFLIDIQQKKHFFMQMVEDLNIYKHFNYFYISKFVAYTGRVFEKPFVLNLQNYKNVRAFIGHRLKRGIAKNSQFLKFKNDLARNGVILQEESLKKYQETQQILYEEYILAHFKIPIDVFRSTCESIILSMKNQKKFFNIIPKLLTKFGPHIKDKKLFCYSISLLYSYFEDSKNYQDIYTLDACSSGLQLISMLFKDDFLANKTNLIGNTKCDIYQECSSALHMEIALAYAHSLHYDSMLTVLELNLTTYLQSHSAPLAEREDFPVWLCSFLGDLAPLYRQELLPLKSYTSWLLTKPEEKFLNLCQVTLKRYPNIRDAIETPKGCLVYGLSLEQLCDALSIYLVLIECRYVYKYLGYPALASTPKGCLWNTFFSRAIPKALIMPTPYGITLHGRMKAVYSVFREACEAENLVVPPIYLRDLSKVAERHFTQKFRKEHLQGLEAFLSISGALKNKKNPKGFQMETDYLSWNFYPKMGKPKRMSSFEKSPEGKRKRRQTTFRISTEKLDSRAFNQAISAILNHSADANIVHRFIHLGRDLLQCFKVSGGGTFDHFCFFLNTNHDSFGISMQHAPLLKPLLFKIYNEFYHSGYLNAIFNDSLQTPENNEHIHNVLAKVNQNSKGFSGKNPIVNPNFVKI